MISLADNRRDALAGARAMLPWLAGILPFGLVIGVSAARSGISTFAGWLTGPLIYAGSAQIAAINMLDAGAVPISVLATVVVINVRLIFYGAALAPYWRGTPLWWRLLAAYLIVDPSFAVGFDRYQRSDEDRSRAHAYYLGSAVLLWATWLAAIALGAVVGGQVPAWLHLEFAVPLFLVGELIPKLSQPQTRRTILVAVATAALTVTAPLHLGVPIAIAFGVGAGLISVPATSQSTKEVPS